MGLYLSLVLAAEFAAVSDSIHTTHAAAALIWGTAVGLAIAHIFAFQLAALLFDDGRLDRETRLSILYQVIVAIAVGAFLCLPLAFASDVSTALSIASYFVAGAIGVTGFAVARVGGRPPLVAAAFAVGMLALAVLVVSVKVAVSH